MTRFASGLVDYESLGNICCPAAFFVGKSINYDERETRPPLLNTDLTNHKTQYKKTIQREKDRIHISYKNNLVCSSKVKRFILKLKVSTQSEHTSEEDDHTCVEMTTSSRKEEQNLDLFRQRNGRQDLSEVQSMPDLFIRPDQRRDIKTFTSPDVVPVTGRKVLATSGTHRSGVAGVPDPSSRWDGSWSSLTVELTPPTLKGLINPSSGRNKLRNKLNMMKSIQPVPFTFEEESVHSSNSMTSSWSATRQPKKSALKKKNVMGGGGSLETRFHCSLSAIEDFDFMSTSSETLTSCSLTKNHSSSTDGSIELAASSATSESESRWKAFTGALNDNNNRGSLLLSPTCPKRRVTSNASDGSLSFPPLLTSYSDDDDTNDKSVASYGSMDLVFDDDDHDDRVPTKVLSMGCAVVYDQNTTGSTLKTESKQVRLASTGCTSHYSTASEGSSSTAQPTGGPIFQCETPKSEYQQKVIEYGLVFRTKDQIRQHSDSGVTNSDEKTYHEAKWTRKHSPTCVAKELDIAINDENLRSCMAMNSSNWTLDQIGSEATPSRDTTITESIKVGHLSSSAAGCNEMPQAPSLKSLPFSGSSTETTKHGGGESTAQNGDGESTTATPGVTKALVGKGKIGNKTEVFFQWVKDAHEVFDRKTNEDVSSLAPKRKRRGSTGTLAKQYGECTISSCAVSTSPSISTDRTRSLVERWEAKIREMNARAEKNHKSIDSHETTDGCSSSAGGTKPSWRQGRQTRRGSTGALIKQFEEKFIPSTSFPSMHGSLQCTSIASADLHQGVALKPDRCESEQASHTTFECVLGSVALNDTGLHDDHDLQHATPVSPSVRAKPKNEQEHALSPRRQHERRLKVAHQRQQNQQQDTDLTPRQGNKQRRRGSTVASAKKFEEEPIRSPRSSVLQKTSPKSAPTSRRRGSDGAFARPWEEHVIERVGAPPLAT